MSGLTRTSAEANCDSYKLISRVDSQVCCASNPIQRATGTSIVCCVVGFEFLFGVVVVENPGKTPRSALLFGRRPALIARLRLWLELNPLEGSCLFEAAVPSLFHVLLPENSLVLVVSATKCTRTKRLRARIRLSRSSRRTCSRVAWAVKTVSLGQLLANHLTIPAFQGDPSEQTDLSCQRKLRRE
jgi:hypothetical protein